MQPYAPMQQPLPRAAPVCRMPLCSGRPTRGSNRREANARPGVVSGVVAPLGRHVGMDGILLKRLTGTAIAGEVSAATLWDVQPAVLLCLRRPG